MPPKKPQNEKFHGLSIRTPTITKEQLAQLVAKLGENQSRVIVRAIAELHAKYCSKPT